MEPEYQNSPAGDLKQTDEKDPLFKSQVSYQDQEYEQWKTLYAAQPTLNQRYFDAQARLVANALINDLPKVRFSLPDRVVVKPGALQPVVIPASRREQVVGSRWRKTRQKSLSTLMRYHLDQLEALENGEESAGIAAAAGLMRFTTSQFMIAEFLPAGRPVVYRAEPGEEIPSIPEVEAKIPISAITAASDAIVEEGQEFEPGQERGELIIPYVPAALRFYLPQWVAFDENDQLIAGSLAEAESQIQAMRRFLRILHSAVALAPYMVADETYQRKRYGMLGQFINQGRALARAQARQIIANIKQRVAEQSLNRGLSVDLPFLDDQLLEMKTYPFQIIPAARIMFVPAFVVKACRQEQAKVAQDTRLNSSTRKHLLFSLALMEAAFSPAGQPD